MKFLCRWVNIALASLLLLTAVCAGQPAGTLPAAAAKKARHAPAQIELANGLRTHSGAAEGAVPVIPRLDISARVRALIPKKGGEISLALANGFVYHLSIPDGALLSDLEVVITPIRALDGLPLSGGLLGGVQLEPDGTTLLKPAELTITAPEGYDLSHMVGYGYHEQGAGFHLDMAEGDGRTITLSISTFSGHGAASGSMQDIADQVARSTGKPLDDFNNRMGSEMTKERAEQLKDYEKNREFNRERFIPILKDFFEASVLPDLKAAAKDDKKIDAAASQFLSWWRDVQLLSLNDEFKTEVRKALVQLERGLMNAFDKASERCVSNQDIKEASNMLTRLYQLALLSLTDGGYTLENKMDELGRCLTFKLNFDSLVTIEMDTNMTISAQVVSNTLLRMDPEGRLIRYQGTGELEYKDYSIEFVGESEKLNDKCRIESQQNGGDLNVIGRIAWYNLNTKEPKQKTVVGVQLGDLTEKITDWKCSSDTSGAMNLRVNVPARLPMWSLGFTTVHESQKAENLEGLANAYLFDNFEPVGGKVVARFADSKSADLNGAKATDDLTMDIVAAPGAK